MVKADIVFAVVVDFQRQMILLFRSFGGSWSFPGGDVGLDESEQDAALRHATEALVHARVAVDEQLGPMYTLLTGKTVKAFVCQIDGEPSPSLTSNFIECRWLDASLLDADVELFECPEVRRMAWDGITITIPTTPRRKQVNFSVEGYFCDPSRPHILVHEGATVRREWLRLDPGQPDGLMPPT